MSGLLIFVKIYIMFTTLYIVNDIIPAGFEYFTLNISPGEHIALRYDKYGDVTNAGMFKNYRWIVMKVKVIAHIRCVAFLLVLAILIGTCDYFFSESGYIRYILHEVKATEENFDTIVIGSSHTRCSVDCRYLDEALGVNSFNIGIPGETVDDFYYVLKSICKDNEVKTVIMDVDYYYWMDGQSQNHFSKSFIYQQMNDTDVKAEYLWNNKDNIDIRNVFSRRLTWKVSLKEAEDNADLKISEGYENYEMEAAVEDDGYFPTAGGPYLGKGFCYRYRINEVPGNPEYVKTMRTAANKNIDKNVISQFERLYNYCKDNGIELIAITAPITPDALEDAQVDRAYEKIADLFAGYGIEYYDFNKTLMSVLPRDDSGYVDTEGHMYGELAELYSEVLAKFLADVRDGEVDMSSYFYPSYQEMYKNMREDYLLATGKEWKEY